VTPSVAAPGDTDLIDATALTGPFFCFYFHKLSVVSSSIFPGGIFTAKQQQYTCGSIDLLNKRTSMSHHYVCCHRYRSTGLHADLENLLSTERLHDEYL